MRAQPSNTLTDQATQKLEAAFPGDHTAAARVIWWDDGGHLESIVEDAAAEIGVAFRAADGFPLDLRIGAVEEQRSTDRPIVWYVGGAKAERDWFRDVRETGGEITCSIEELTAELYEVNAWDIFDVERHDADDRADAAKIIRSEFATHGIPQYNDLKEEIITRGGGQVIDNLLRDGWPEISRKQETVDEVRSRLQDNHDIPVEDDADPEAITETVRRWAVAEALVENDVNPSRFPTGFGDAGYSPLTELLEIRGARASADKYLGERFWPAVIDDLDEPWAHAGCPVDAALDVVLWESWMDRFEAGELDPCIELAHQRQDALSVYPDETAWVQLWNQMEHVARLQQQFDAWESRDDDTDPFDQYADAETGSWRIDNEVLQLQLTGQPEADLQLMHPARDTLPELRNQLLTTRYREYLDTLADAVEASMQVGAPLVDKSPAYEWWSDHEDDFDELGTVAIFLIDALRFDLAQQLADRLSGEFEVKQETRMATLPSETKFGMAALTPGRSFRFEIGMDDGGETLTVSQGDRSLSNKQQRISFYDDEGWAVPDGLDDGWEHHYIAYYDKDIDDVGEGEIGDIERHFGTYIEDLSKTIRTKLKDENWDRIYVVTDHGFVLLPEDTLMESVSADQPETETKYRRIAGDSLEDVGHGVHLPHNTAGLDYLNTNLQLLVDPRQHFSKQGYTSYRYYHGGVLPQECMLSFLEIQQ